MQQVQEQSQQPVQQQVLQTQYLHDYCLKIEFEKSVSKSFDTHFFSSELYGEWEITDSNKCYHLYFYEFNEDKTILYIQSERGWYRQTCVKKDYDCLIEDINNTFENAPYKITYYLI